MSDETTHDRPSGVSDATVAAVGQVTEALEWVERARGHLFEFHQQMGHADHTLGQAADALEEAGHADLAHRVRTTMVGRNALEGRWTFEIVEEFDDGYYAGFKGLEAAVRAELLQGRRHVFEAELKRSEQEDLDDPDPRPGGAGGPGDPSAAVPTRTQDRAHAASMAAHLDEVDRQIAGARQGAQRDRVLHDGDQELTSGWDSEPA